MYIEIFNDGYKCCLKYRDIYHTHNVYGIALLDVDGQAEYRVDNTLHNIYGPAVIFGDILYYFINGIKYEYDAWYKEVNKYKR